MGKIASANTIYATAYLTDIGRNYLFNKGNSRFVNNQDMLAITSFALSDSDTNYQTMARLVSGDVPDISGKNDNCIKATAGAYEQKNILYQLVDTLTFAVPEYQTINLTDNTLRLDLDSTTVFPPAQANDSPPVLNFNNTSTPNPTIDQVGSISSQKAIESQYVPNASLSVLFKKQITFQTIDKNNGDAIIDESYNIGKASPSLTPIGENKYILKLPKASNKPQYVLKFHYPNTNANPKDKNITVTFAVENGLMGDGYYDYKTGVPADYLSTLRNWVFSPVQSSGIGAGLKTKSVSFDFYGATTNKKDEAKTSYFEFSYFFSAAPPLSSKNANQGFVGSVGSVGSGGSMSSTNG